MEFIYSFEIDPDAYETHGLADGVPLRMHKDTNSEFQGIARAQKDWSNHVSPIEGYNGGIGDPYSFISVTVPECLPDRLEIISYANEFAFLYDGKVPVLWLRWLNEAETKVR